MPRGAGYWEGAAREPPLRFGCHTIAVPSVNVDGPGYAALQTFYQQQDDGVLADRAFERSPTV